VLVIHREVGEVQGKAPGALGQMLVIHREVGEFKEELLTRLDRYS
jgi:hypothetical protein